MKTLLKIYAFIRTFTSPIIWRLTNKRVEDGYEEFEKFISTVDMEEASDILNSKEYISDKLKGALDCSVPRKWAHTFFSDKAKTRDCDDFARMWSLWGSYYGYDVKEWFVIERRFKKAHMITTLSKDGEYWLMNYRPYGPHKSLEDALNVMAHWYKDPVVEEYKWMREW